MIIGEVGAIIDSILRHLPPFAIRTVIVIEYGRLMMFLDVKEKRGLSQEKRG